MNIWWGRRLRKLIWYFYRNSRREAQRQAIAAQKKQQQTREQVWYVPYKNRIIPVKSVESPPDAIYHSSLTGNSWQREAAQEVKKEDWRYPPH
jgi:hypothetical protein